MYDFDLMRFCATKHNCTRCKKMARESACSERFQYCSQAIAEAGMRMVNLMSRDIERIVRGDDRNFCELCRHRPKETEGAESDVCTKCSKNSAFRYDPEVRTR